MADNTNSKIDAAAAKAYEEAAAAKGDVNEAIDVSEVAEAVEADKKPAPAKKKTAAKKAAPKKVAAKRKKKTPAKTKTVTRKTTVAAKKAAAKKTTKPAAKSATVSIPNISDLKDKIMATAKNTDVKATIEGATADMQARVKTVYAKGSELASEATELNKANLEAVVESGKILASGMQDMGRAYVEEAKGAFETVTADAKKVAAVKSPTELFQLQGEIARRNFDAMMTTGSKNTEMMVKLANDAFAPISTRMSVTAQKLKNIAA